MTAQQLIEENLDLLGPRCAQAAKKYGDDPGEYMAAGYLGLRRAAEKFSPDRGAKFTTYANDLINWSIAEQARLARGRVQNGNSKKHDFLKNTVSLDRLGSSDLHRGFEPAASDELNRIDELDAIRSLTRDMSRTEKLVITLYYVEGMLMREIGDVLGMTVSNVSLIHKELLKRLRVKLSNKRE